MGNLKKSHEVSEKVSDLSDLLHPSRSSDRDIHTLYSDPDRRRGGSYHRERQGRFCGTDADLGADDCSDRGYGGRAVGHE